MLEEPEMSCSEHKLKKIIIYVFVQEIVLVCNYLGLIRLLEPFGPVAQMHCLYADRVQRK